MSKTYKLKSVCRTCAKSSTHEDLIPLFPNGAINDIKKYQNAEFQVSEDDGLPQQICGECLDQFNDMNEFIQKCGLKQTLLEKRFNIIKIKETFKEENIDNEKNNKNEESLIMDEIFDEYDYETETLHEDFKIEIIDEKSMEIENKDEESNARNYDEINDDNFVDDDSKTELYDEIDIAKELQKAIKLAHESALIKENSMKISKLDFDESNDDEDAYWNSADHNDNANLKDDSNAGFSNDFSCDLCPEKDMSFNQLQEHLKYKHKKKSRAKSVMCEICGEVVKDNKLKYHMNAHLGIPNETRDCQICGKTGLSVNQFKSHLYKHETPKHHCEYCRKGFRNYRNLQIHYQTNPNKKCLEIKKRSHNKKGPKASLQCLYCMKKFLNAVSLVRHCQTHRKPDFKDAKHICNYCNTVFKRADHLKIHINSQHLKTEEFKCQLCDKICYASFRLNLHMKTKHLNAPSRPQCEYCQKSFYNVQCVKRHQAETHSTEKLFKCPICAEEFFKKNELTKHSKIHDVLITNELQKEIILKECCPNIVDNSTKKKKSKSTEEDIIIEEIDEMDNYTVYDME